ncbi:MAG: hydrogenase [Clostridiales Family XIII bacterium]|jgi:nitrogenase molybdenum-iron protein beta chain|nr:hydrogenase [Clostridiales Family XIII bacterium]
MAGLIEQERYTCAIGALQSVVAIPKAVPILHAGPGCGNMIMGFFERSTGYAGGNTSPCTNFSESEVIFGGIDRLRQIVKNTYKVLDTDIQVILSGCTAGIVGDDIESLVDEFRAEGKNIVAVETPGFKCNNFEAHSLVVNAIIDQYVALFEEEQPYRSDKNAIILLSSIPYQDPFWKGNLAEYKRLLHGIGLDAKVLFGPKSDGVEEWKRIPRANFTALVSPWYGEPIAEHLEEKYGQPFVHFPHIPIGANETERFLRTVLAFAEKQGAEIDRIAAERFIRRETEAYYEEIDNLATFLLEFRYGLPNHAHIFHDAGYVLGLSKFLLHETGIVPKEQFVVDGIPERYHDGIRRELAKTSDKKNIPLFFEPDAGKAQDVVRSLHHNGRGIIIGSGWDRELAEEKEYDFLSASAPSPYRLVLTSHYAGYSGGLRVIEDIYNTSLATYR